MLTSAHQWTRRLADMLSAASGLEDALARSIAVLAILAFRLLVTLRSVEPFVGPILLDQSPWPSIVCYGATFLMLLVRALLK